MISIYLNVKTLTKLLINITIQQYQSKTNVSRTFSFSISDSASREAKEKVSVKNTFE